MDSKPDPRRPRPGARRKIRATLATVAAALLLGACGDDSDGVLEPGAVDLTEGMTDAELSLRLSLEAARDARLAAASRMTDAERSLRIHLEAARDARLAAASRMTDAERSLRIHLEAAREVMSK